MKTAEIAKTKPVSRERGSENPVAPIRCEFKDDVCILIFDRPGSAANVFDRATLLALDSQLRFIEQERPDGVIVTSAKNSIFIAGADLKELAAAVSGDALSGMIELGQRVFQRLAHLPMPTVAAIHGACAGGGYELALACDYRVASDDAATKIGLPETQLGIIPAWGGSARLPRLVGLPCALGAILGGNLFSAAVARRKGLVDDVAPREKLLELAIRKLRLGKRKLPKRLLVNNPLTASVIAMRAQSELLKRTRGHYPALPAAVRVLTNGISHPIESALELEREAILQLARTGECRNLVRVFFLQERARKLTVPGAPAGAPRFSRAAVIGAGIMGSGIAQWLAARGMRVLLRDINAQQVGKGMASIRKLFDAGVKRHLFTRHDAQRALDNIIASPEEVSLGDTEVVVEAAVEKMPVKKQLFQRLDALAGPRSILATNTSALSISELAASTAQPERVVGLHFFNPVHRMKLVEVVAGKQTSPDVLAGAVKFVQQIGKLPVVVQDSPGFVVNRVLMPYLIEAAALFERGADVEDIDEAMLDFGMPMGPLRLIDEVGLDVADDVVATLIAAFPERLRPPGVLPRMMEAGLRGRKTGRGFYYYENGEALYNAQVNRFQLDRLQDRFPAGALQKRMVLVMINEAARCIEEKIVAGPEDVDFAMIMGTGWAPFRGGPLRFADSASIAQIVSDLHRLAGMEGAGFSPCDLLREMAASGRRFYND